MIKGLMVYKPRSELVTQIKRKLRPRLKVRCKRFKLLKAKGRAIFITDIVFMLNEKRFPFYN